jgi:hypothetical protein
MVGKLETPVAELAAEAELEEQSDASEPHILSLFGERIPVSWIKQIKTKRRRGSRRR